MAEHVHHVPLAVDPSGQGSYACVGGVCQRTGWLLWGEQPDASRGYYLGHVRPEEPLVRTLLDAYGRELACYWPATWQAEGLVEDASGHLPWPALVGDAPEAGLSCHLVLATGQELVAGLCTLREWPDWGEIRDLYIRPEWRRLGAGRAVVAALQRRWPSGILIDVLRANEPAQWFWTKMGFERLGDSPRWGAEASRAVAVHGWPGGRFNLGKP